ncbi:hypothetical protein EI42_01241 [Thermosporothrix hazakensis]|jgi:hypothetical protein|uniref:V8-like Glu-specific endopeptidase n=2 Tax=Thermosporothrix TaxID=768650 RepID=A0A326UFC6_THEHA|nr:hypothetical protein [Thermosporothrix hazakensis]PZW34404.1 hypothetical protein EI42_01241 [Thermosporothrix hazakensis]BBH85527.1 peptidase [Thermosporothrix sp. COM3]GCE46046.1 peptidase [Thermosporothrix hazakensis]
MHREKRMFIIGGLFLSLSLALLLVLQGYQPAQAAKPNKHHSVISHSPDKLLRSMSNYWTPARMKAAKPIQTLIIGNEKNQKKQDGVMRPFAAAVPVSSYSQFPYSTIGKIFFTDSRTGEDYQCSGTSTQSQNGSVVDTAGHCVVEGGSAGNWYTNWIFCPQYRDGSCPKGQWSQRTAYTSSDWYYNGSFGSDLADVVVNTNGSTLNATVGAVRFAYNLSQNQQFLSLGYPAAPPFNGQRMYSCSSGVVSQDPQYGGIGISCNMTGGCSGGGWLIRQGNTWAVNGHNDYGRGDGIMYSPYYGDDAYEIFNAAQTA